MACNVLINKKINNLKIKRKRIIRINDFMKNLNKIDFYFNFIFVIVFIKILKMYKYCINIYNLKISSIFF